MNKKLLALYGLKWNPFSPSVPAEALHVTPRIDSFCRRVQLLTADGGFASITGAPGTGKSVALRILANQLAAQRDVKVAVISRPQAGLADFYREMGDLFGIELHPHNRWGGAKVLRQRPCKFFSVNSRRRRLDSRRVVTPPDLCISYQSSSPHRPLRAMLKPSASMTRRLGR